MMAGGKHPGGVTLPPQGDCEPLEPSDVLEWAGKECVLGPDGKVSYRETEAADDLRGVTQYIDRLYEKQPAVSGATGGKVKGENHRQHREWIEGLMEPLIIQGLRGDEIVERVRGELRRLTTGKGTYPGVRMLTKKSLKRHYLSPLRKKLKAEGAQGRA